MTKEVVIKNNTENDILVSTPTSDTIQIDTPKESEGWEDRFDSLVYHNEPSGWGGQDAVRCVNAEHLGDVVSKLLPKVKDFIHQEIAQAKSSTRRETLEEVMDISPTWVAQAFHDYYGGYAELKGWETNKDCRVAFEDLPEANKATMVCTSSAVLRDIAGKIINKHIKLK